jgi:hypothetical protein
MVPGLAKFIVIKKPATKAQPGLCTLWGKPRSCLSNRDTTTMRLGSVEGQELMWWLTYRRSGKASGVVLIVAP